MPVGHARSINDRNDFGEFFVNACIAVVNNSKNAVIFNHFTDGKSYER